MGGVIVQASSAPSSAGDSQLEHKTRLRSAGGRQLSSHAAKFALTGEITASQWGVAPNRVGRGTRQLELGLRGLTCALQLRGIANENMFNGIFRLSVKLKH